MVTLKPASVTTAVAASESRSSLNTKELKEQFAGKNAAQFSYTKTGAASEDQIDAISGATITTNAVVNGVNAGLTYFHTELTEGGSGNE